MTVHPVSLQAAAHGPEPADGLAGQVLDPLPDRLHAAARAAARGELRRGRRRPSSSARGDRGARPTRAARVRVRAPRRRRGARPREGGARLAGAADGRGRPAGSRPSGSAAPSSPARSTTWAPPGRRAARAGRALSCGSGASRSATTTRQPRAGTTVTCWTLARSGRGEAARSVTRFSTSRSTTRISTCANEAPMQRRTPPPNGIQAYDSAPPSRKRSGRNSCGSG